MNEIDAATRQMPRTWSGLAASAALQGLVGASCCWDEDSSRGPAHRTGGPPVSRHRGEARARPDSDSWYQRQNLAELLAAAGRLEEAVALLAPAVPANRSVLAGHLMELGHIKDAVAVLRRAPERFRALPRDGDDPPF